MICHQMRGLSDAFELYVRTSSFYELDVIVVDDLYGEGQGLAEEHGRAIELISTTTLGEGVCVRRTDNVAVGTVKHHDRPALYLPVRVRSHVLPLALNREVRADFEEARLGAGPTRAAIALSSPDNGDAYGQEGYDTYNDGRLALRLLA